MIKVYVRTPRDLEEYRKYEVIVEGDTGLVTVKEWDNGDDAEAHAKFINGAINWHPDTEHLLKHKY